MNYSRRTSALIDLAAIERNFARICAPIPDSVRRCLVIKTDGYGHGAAAIAKRLADRADFLAVAAMSEARELREAGVTLPILILGYCFPEEYEEMIEREIRITVFRESDAEAVSAAAERLHRTAKIHIKVDTGMNRIGFAPTEASAESIRRIRALPGVETEGIFTHFARADEADKSDAEEQFRRFCSFVREVEEGGTRIPIHHCANSAASMEMPETWLDMVRIGISLYGIYPSEEVDHTSVRLEPALTWESEAVLIKEVPAGAGISYNHTCRLQRDSRVATVPVGYGDGYPRTLSNCGCVLIRGKRAPILGRVCMDQMMVDVTDIPEAAEGDRVVLVGRDGDAVLPVEELSALSGRFPYEFVCDIGKRVPRIVISTGLESVTSS